MTLQVSSSSNLHRHSSTWSSGVISWRKRLAVDRSVEPLQIRVSEPQRLVNVNFSEAPSVQVDVSLLFLFKDVLGKVGVLIQLFVVGRLTCLEQLILCIDLKKVFENDCLCLYSPVWSDWAILEVSWQKIFVTKVGDFLDNCDSHCFLSQAG